MLQALFTSQARIRLLSILLLGQGERWYLRKLASEARVSVGNADRELRSLAAAGIVLREISGRQVYYRIDENCPIIPELRSMFTKTVGVADALRSALAQLRDRICAAFVYGSFAKDSITPQSDVDLMVVGDVSFLEVVSAACTAQDRIGREVNPTVYPAREFRDRIVRGEHFIAAIMSEPKVFIIGDEHGLDQVGLGNPSVDPISPS